MTTDTTPRHERAFELYASMAKRSYGRVAREIGVSASSVKAWSREHRWRQRLMEREIEHARQIADRAASGPDPDNVRNLKIVRVAIMKIARAIAEGRVKATMGDLDRMVKLEERLLGIHGIDPLTLGRAAAHLHEVENMSVDQLKAELRKVAMDFGVIKTEELAEPEKAREILVNGCINSYRQYTEDRERIKAAIADIDAGRDPAQIPPQGRPSIGTVFGGEGTKRDNSVAGPPNQP